MKRNILIMALFTIGVAAEKTTILSSSSEWIDLNQSLKTEYITYNNIVSFCFEKGTMVTMADGSSKPIEKVTPGDKILSVNTLEMSVENDIVEKVDSAICNNFVKIFFDDLTMNVNTDDHLYYVKGKGWCSANPELTFRKYKVRAGSLKPGDDCYKILNGRLVNVKISTIQRIPGRQTGFSIVKLNKNSSFFANGKLVSIEEVETIKEQSRTKLKK